MPEDRGASGTEPARPGDVELRCGAARALWRPRAGARLCTLVLQPDHGQAVPVLFPYTPADVDPLHWAKGGLYPLIPYSNRIGAARLHTPQGEVALAPHPDALPHTLHGNAHGLPWHVEAHSAQRIELSLHCPAGPAWPWAYAARLVGELPAPDRLELQLAVRNADRRPMPAGLGWHPYFLHRPQARLRFHAPQAWRQTPDGLAVGAADAGAEQRFEPARALRAGALTDYLSGWDGQLDLELPGGERLRLHADAAVSHLVLHRPADERYLCVEPVTHVADGFNLQARGVAGTGTQWLAPGEELAATLSLSLADRATQARA